jgi:hypothetical protein
VLECVNKMWKITEDDYFHMNHERVFVYFLKRLKISSINECMEDYIFVFMYREPIVIIVHTVLQVLFILCSS